MKLLAATFAACARRAQTGIRVLLPVYFLTLSMVDAFNFSGTITIAIMLTALMAIVLGMHQFRKPRAMPTLGLTFYLAAAFILVALASLVYQAVLGHLGSHTIPHWISYAAVFMLFWAVVESYIKFRKEPLRRIFRMVTIGALVAAVFVIVEFIAKNFLGIAIDNLLPRVSTDHYGALYFVGNWAVFRARGFASESGHIALYLLIFLPFVYYNYAHYSLSRVKAYGAAAIMCAATACTISTAALADLVVAGLLVSGIYVLSRRSRQPLLTMRSRIVAISLVAFVVVLALMLQVTTGSIALAFQGILNKLSFADHSPGSRFERWGLAFSIFANSPILGGGPGAAVTADGTGSANLYLDILADTGVLGLGIFLTLLAVVLRRILKLETSRKWVYLFSFFVAGIHYLSMSNYWYPWVWLVFALVNYEYGRERNRVGRGGVMPVADPQPVDGPRDFDRTETQAPSTAPQGTQTQTSARRGQVV
jgi:hypothetical protein